jgi:RND superfamily putative drug exporter
VAISLLALVALPVPFLRSIGVAGLLIALVSVAVAVTLLPVVLATVGPRLDWPRNRRDARAGRAWSAWARLVVRHRWAAAVTSTAVLAALVVAASTIQLGNPRADSLANAGPARAGIENWRARACAQATPRPSRRRSPKSTVSGAILGLAFAAFSASPGTEAKIFATALGGGILIDATIIRGILAPAAVAILGRWNWWLPDRAMRILRVEPSRAQPYATPDPATQAA